VADEGQRTKVWRLEEAYSDSGVIPVKLHREVLDLLRTRFGYVLVDCPSLRASAAALPMAGLSDGALLVVGAGEARRDQVEQAQRLLEGASCQLLGLILNKRTYPVPRFLYQRL
jgi:Mrp family chromosome partitioning ATPase